MIPKFILRVIDRKSDRNKQYWNHLHKHRDAPCRCGEEFEAQYDDAKDNPRERCFPKCDHESEENKKHRPEHPDIS